MRRVPHRLTANEANTRPQYMIFVDTETGIQPVGGGRTEYPFKLGVAHYWRRRRDGNGDQHEWFEFTDVDSFWWWVEARCHKNSVTYLVAHNLLFDMAALDFLNQLGNNGWECVFAFDNNQTSLYKWRRNGCTLHCVNNANIFRGKLADWAEAVGTAQRHVDFATASDDELFERCARDVDIMSQLWRWWLDFLDEHDCGIFKPTIAAQSFQVYRHRFMAYPLYCHNNEAVLELERAAYRGGRTEVFRAGDYTGVFYKLDVNSMYPAAMTRYRYPNNLVIHGYTPSPARLALLLKRGNGVIASVTVDTDEPWFPIKRDGRNVYPVGQFETVLTTEELRLALKRGWIKDIRRYARYTMRPLFVDFVHYFYQLKEGYTRSGNMVLAKLVKELLNALHGKFGQRGWEQRVIGQSDREDPRIINVINAQNHERYTIREMGGQLIQEKKDGEAFNSFPAIAAHVTANARLELYRLVRQAGRDHCYYCDTDSLIVDQHGLENLLDRLDATALGQLKVEEVANEIDIRAPKDYTFGSRLVCKGIPLNAGWLDDSSANVEIWPGLNSYLSQGPDPTYQTTTIVRTLAREIHSGHVGEDGWIEPFVYPADEG